MIFFDLFCNRINLSPFAKNGARNLQMRFYMLSSSPHTASRSSGSHRQPVVGLPEKSVAWAAKMPLARTMCLFDDPAELGVQMGSTNVLFLSSMYQYKS